MHVQPINRIFAVIDWVIEKGEMCDLFLIFRVSARAIRHNHVVTTLKCSAGYFGPLDDDVEVVAKRSGPVEIREFLAEFTTVDKVQEFLRVHSELLFQSDNHGQQILFI